MDIVHNINENIPFTFAKYGDGEYFASQKIQGHNCDNTKYTQNLGNAVIESYKYLAPLSNTYIGKWGDEKVIKFFEELIIPKWDNYLSLITRSIEDFNRTLPILKCIKNSKQQKIYVCNSSLNSISHLFNINKTVNIHESDWFDESYDNILKETIASVINPNSIIILTSAGMGAKPLLAELRKKFPNSILLDVGSGFDAFAYRKSRDYNMNFSKEEIDRLIKLI